MIDDAEIKQHLATALHSIELHALPLSYRGKVRDNFDLVDGTRIVVSTDRLSVFDQIVGCVPFKGQIINQVALYWFQQTSDIMDNHVLVEIDPNVIVVKRLNMIPIEVVVRAYMTGTSRTSLWTLYRAGNHAQYGLHLPTGLRENYPLPQPVLTLTTKAIAGEHDKPISASDVVANGLLTAERLELVSDVALRLFARGSEIARSRGLLLVDTKYEFGSTPDGRLMVADEIHTPDSSRYWYASSYDNRVANSEAPENLDKDFARAWVAAHYNLYRNRVLQLPPDIVISFTNRYISLYETITGVSFVPPLLDPPLSTRIQNNIELYHRTGYFAYSSTNTL